MNSYLYDDLQSDELPEFQLYQTEAEYWEEMDRIHTLIGR